MLSKGSVSGRTRLAIRRAAAAATAGRSADPKRSVSQALYTCGFPTIDTHHARRNFDGASLVIPQATSAATGHYYQTLMAPPLLPVHQPVLSHSLCGYMSSQCCHHCCHRRCPALEPAGLSKKALYTPSLTVVVRWSLYITHALANTFSHSKWRYCTHATTASR